MAFRIEDIELGDDTGPLAELVACWRASVEATHTFLTPDDIERIAAYVPDAIASVAHLAVCRDENGQVVGFIGVDGTMIEMLFIHPSLRGCGLGSLLLDHAVSEHGATLVDVNEQNGQAVGFYEHSGDWLYATGLPAKTGVGGAVIGVMPGLFGVCAFAPPLDDAGNSVKAQAALKHLMKSLNLNVFSNTHFDLVET
jgi:GNAT superfamily N-acetyltransferase